MTVRPERKIRSILPAKKEPPSAPLLAILYAIFIAVAIYSATLLATIEPSIKPIAIPVAVALGIIIFLLGFSKSDQPQSGYLAIALALLPGIYRWSALNKQRQFAAASALLFASAATVLGGPYATQTYSIACDDAVNVTLRAGEEPSACTGALTKTIWRPTQPFTPLESFFCSDKQRNQWAGSKTEAFAGRCGSRPLDASYVTNGIPDLKTREDTVSGRRISEGVARLRKALGEGPQQIPDRRFNDRIVFATWNLRDLGNDRFERRSEEGFFYIAEVISHFDIVAVQEVGDLAAVHKILAILGGQYGAEFGYIAPGAAGNRERQGFIYDKRKVKLGNISTTLVIDPQTVMLPGTGQPARPPFLAEFETKAGVVWAATAHVYFGSGYGESRQRRILEITAMARGVAKVFTTAPQLLSIFAGDFNTPSRDSPEITAFDSQGFSSDPELIALESGTSGASPYDQIMTLKESWKNFPFGQVGVFPVFNFVYRDNDLQEYKTETQKGLGFSRQPDQDLRRAFQRYRTYQVSDHYPKWAEFQLPSTPIKALPQQGNDLPEGGM